VESRIDLFADILNGVHKDQREKNSLIEEKITYLNEILQPLRKEVSSAIEDS